MGRAGAVVRSRPVQVGLAFTYLFPPLLMVFLWFRFVSPDGPGPWFTIVFAAVFLVLCWYGVGWFLVSLRRALGREPH